MKRTEGFTLVELMVVIVIIGILAAVAMPRYTKALSKAGQTDAMSTAGPMRNAITEFYGYRGRFPRSHAELGLPEPDSIYGRYVERVEWIDTAIVVTFNSKRYELSQDTVKFTPVVSMAAGDALISWEIEQVFTEEPRLSEVSR